MDNKNFVAHEDATFVADAQATEGASCAAEQQHPGPPPDYFSEDMPPAYQVASALPTYEEAELTKGTLKTLLTTWTPNPEFNIFQRENWIQTWLELMWLKNLIRIPVVMNMKFVEVEELAIVLVDTYPDSLFWRCPLTTPNSQAVRLEIWMTPHS